MESFFVNWLSSSIVFSAHTVCTVLFRSKYHWTVPRTLRLFSQLIDNFSLLVWGTRREGCFTGLQSRVLIACPETQLSKIQAVFSKDVLIVRSHGQKLLLSVFQKPFSNKMSERHWLNLDLVPMKQLRHPYD